MIGDEYMAKNITVNVGKPSKRTINEWKWAYFLVAPTIIGLIILNIIPIIETLYLSFFKSGDLEKEIYLLA